MKTITFLSAILLTAKTLLGQVNYFDTSFYSPALDKEKMVKVYLPPDYNENQPGPPPLPLIMKIPAVLPGWLLQFLLTGHPTSTVLKITLTPGSLSFPTMKTGF